MTRVTLSGRRIDEVLDESSAHRICQEPQRDWERWWTWGSEKLNPILVKEVRQSLKSRQFELSFGLTLIACIAWTFLCVSFTGPSIYYIPSGLNLLVGYVVILLVPLFIVIPFTAFRSLTSEMEESTYELLSISSLSARQIVQGKMATSLLQILLYVSALAPCIVMTYLLRGVSLLAVLLILAAMVAYSVMLVSCSLVIASISRTRAGQSGMSVLLLAFLVISFIGFVGNLAEGDLLQIFTSSPPREIFIIVFAVTTILFAIFSLLMQAAAAAIDFPAENKSTPIRRRILVLLATCMFWGLILAFGLDHERSNDPEQILVIFTSGTFFVFLAIGGMMCGERGVIAPRAQRTLPATFLGRVFCTWLSPGAGLGYMFLVLTFASVCLLFVTMVQFRIGVGATGRPFEFTLWCTAMLAYLIFYVGLCRLCMLGIGKSVNSPIVVSFALLIILLLVIQLVPYLLAVYWNDFGDVQYAWHQAFNIFMTLEAITRQNAAILPSLTILTLASAVVFGLNLMLTTRDVMLVRIEAPERVKRETAPAEPEVIPEDPFAG